MFFLAYFILAAYTVPTQLGYALYPEKLSEVSHYQYYGEKAFFPYWTYIFLSFIAIFVVFAALYNRKFKLSVKLEARPSLKKNAELLYILVLLLYEFIVTFFLVRGFGSLSYSTQSVLKHNKIWFYCFSLNGVVLLSIFYKLHTERNIFARVFYFTVFSISLSVFLMTAIRSGQRSEVAMTVLGFVASLWYLFRDKIRRRGLRLKHAIVILTLVFVLVGFAQGVRTARGHNESVAEILSVLKEPQTFLSLFSLKTLIFQDWLPPSLCLMTSIEGHIVFPGKVVESNITCLIPFMDHSSLGETLARMVAPESERGYGYYILCEGYNLMGFWGFLYSAFLFVFCLRVLECFFANTRDELFNAYMFGIMGYLAIWIVRGGQSMTFLKVVYLYFVPAIMLFMLMGAGRVYLVRLKRRIR